MTKQLTNIVAEALIVDGNNGEETPGELERSIAPRVVDSSSSLDLDILIFQSWKQIKTERKISCDG